MKISCAIGSFIFLATMVFCALSMSTFAVSNPIECVCYAQSNVTDTTTNAVLDGVDTSALLPSFLDTFEENELIEFYETNIAKEKVVEQYSTEQIEALANKYGVDTTRVKAAIIMSDMSKRNGKEKRVEELVSLPEKKLVRFGYAQLGKYFRSLTKAEQEELSTKFDELKN